MRKQLNRIALCLLLNVAAGSAANAASPTGWAEARSTHFIVVTDANEEEALRLASHFERMRLVFRALLPTPDADSGPPMTVLAMKDKRGMRAMEPMAYLAGNQMDLAGFFLRAPDRNYILMRLDAQQEYAYSTVYHEYTHYMLRKADTWLPLWLNEGLAQFYENTDIDDKTAWLGETNTEALNLLKRNNLLPIATLLRVNAQSPYYHNEDESSIFYAESWALTHYLIVSDRIQGTHRMHDYTRMLEQGEDSVTAAGHAFGDLSMLQARLNDYIMQRKFMYFMMPARLDAKSASIEVRAIAPADADALRADLMMHTGRTSEAKALDDEVLKIQPENALAHETMGALRHRAGDLAGAAKWYGEAVALNPQSYVAQFYYAVAMLRTKSTGDAASNDDATIETGLRATMRLNPEFAPAYDALAILYAMQHRNLDEAHALDMRAIDLEPGQLSFRLDCADVLAQQRQFTDALAVLQAAMHLAKTPEEMEATRSRMAWVQLSQMTASTAPESAPRRGGFGQ
jgi:tetratricopeptide (TPR) repeat protein